MKLAIVGSRTITNLDISQYIPEGVTEIVSGGARGIDTLAAEYARAHRLILTEFLPEYDKYGKSAPLRRNDLIVGYADEGIAFWDGVSRGTMYTVKRFEKLGKKITVIKI